MSATPIPRTLEMAVTGIREMSTIATPPEERHPVLTYVGAYDDKQIAAAIRRELLRDGQVFYVHNRVESIEKAAARIRELVPEARVATAHGQMGEDALEQVIVDFWEKEFDVLVCTTIVETGLDIPNANTLIVERADLLGLSQLHQLRGRVGRGRERAYAYFLYPPEKPLTETAHDRLATIAQHTELGRGHAGGDEGPGDPRARATCSAASSPGTSPTSASTCTSGWSARRWPSTAARRPRSSPRCGSSCPSTRTCRTTTCRASGCGWRCTAAGGGARATRRSTSVRDELVDRYGLLPPAGRDAARGRAAARAGPRRRADRARRAGRPDARSARWTCRSRASCGCSGSTRAPW